MNSELMDQYDEEERILQGLRVAQAAVTERWPSRKIARKLPFFLGEKKISPNILA